MIDKEGLKKTLQENIELLYDLIIIIDKTDIKDEFDSSIRLFLCSIVNNLEEAYYLLTINRNSGIANYFRTALEGLVYLMCIAKDNNMLYVIKNKDYVELKKIRNEYKQKGINIPERDIDGEIATIKDRIRENQDLIDSFEGVSYSESREKLFNYVSMSNEYTQYFRFFSRKGHPNIFEIHERYTTPSGRVTKPTILNKDLLVYIKFIDDYCNNLLVVITKEYSLPENFTNKLQANLKAIQRHCFDIAISSKSTYNFT